MPYRDLPAPAAGVPWRRWLVDSFADLRDSAWWRRWAGGRWAAHAFVYNDSPWRGARTICHGFDVAAAEVHGPDADVAFDAAADLARERWRALDACPHGRVAVLHETRPGELGVVHRAHPCTCELHPTPRPLLAFLGRVVWSSVIGWTAASFAVTGTLKGGLMGGACFLAMGLLGAVRWDE